MQEDRDVQRAEIICDFQNRKALLDKQFRKYLKDEGFIFHYLAEEKQSYAIHPDYYSAWLKNRKWATYRDWIVVKIDN